MLITGTGRPPIHKPEEAERYAPKAPAFLLKNWASVFEGAKAFLPGRLVFRSEYGQEFQATFFSGELQGRGIHALDCTFGVRNFLVQFPEKLNPPHRGTIANSD